tara:strand:- start:126 stop:245 length:120 start_codon:yes stop_codon:yes gene_type:complete
MKRAFWILALGAVVSAVMAATIGRAEDAPVAVSHTEGMR